MAIKPPGWDRTGLEAVRFFLIDPDNGTILGRTPLSWLKITCFYIIFYSCLAAFSIGMFYVFLQTIPDKSSGPKWQLDASLIGSNPGQLTLFLSGHVLTEHYQVLPPNPLAPGALSSHSTLPILMLMLEPETTVMPLVGSKSSLTSTRRRSGATTPSLM